MIGLASANSVTFAVMMPLLAGENVARHQSDRSPNAAGDRFAAASRDALPQRPILFESKELPSHGCVSRPSDGTQEEDHELL